MSDGPDLEGEGICHSSVRNEMENKQAWWSWRRRAAHRTGNEFDAKNGTREIELRKMWGHHHHQSLIAPITRKPNEVAGVAMLGKVRFS